jgi:hypothetical protein
MTHQEILTKAIDKAVAGGWKPFEYGMPTRIEQWQGDHMVNIAVDFPLHTGSIDWVRELEGIIFNHDFAKALWGDSIGLYGIAKRNIVPGFVTPEDVRDLRKMYLWQYHLQQMVVADDPIKYLRENI